MQSDMCKIIVAEDHAMMLDRVLALLRMHFEVVASVNNGQDLISETQRLSPDVVVTDISMPILNGIAAAVELRKVGSSARVVFLTVHNDTALVEKCFAEGGLGYVHKSRLRSDLIPAIKEALCGRHFVSSVVDRSARRSADCHIGEGIGTLSLASED